MGNRFNGCKANGSTKMNSLLQKCFEYWFGLIKDYNQVRPRQLVALLSELASGDKGRGTVGSNEPMGLVAGRYVKESRIKQVFVAFSIHNFVPN